MAGSDRPTLWSNVRAVKLRVPFLILHFVHRLLLSHSIAYITTGETNKCMLLGHKLEWHARNTLNVCASCVQSANARAHFLLIGWILTCVSGDGGGGGSSGAYDSHSYASSSTKEALEWPTPRHSTSLRWGVCLPPVKFGRGSHIEHPVRNFSPVHVSRYSTDQEIQRWVSN